jgi:hypothetical protein
MTNGHSDYAALALDRHQAVPPRLLADARETVRACPRLALRLERGEPPGSRRSRRTGGEHDGPFGR